MFFSGEKNEMQELNKSENQDVSFSAAALEKFDRLMDEQPLEENVAEAKVGEGDRLMKQEPDQTLFQEASELRFKQLMDDTGKNKIEQTNKNDISEKGERNYLMPRTGGSWTGEPGNSNWVPDDKVVPGDRNGTNPESKKWKVIKKEYGFDGVCYKDGGVEFKEVSKGEVKIPEFTDERDANFAQADEKLAEQKGCTPETVEAWRRENKYTWHECMDCQTMQKVPTEVHGNIPHSGGISEYKAKQRLEEGEI